MHVPFPPAGAEGAAGGEDAEVVAGADETGGAGVVDGVDEDEAGGVAGTDDVEAADDVVGAEEVAGAEEGAAETELVDVSLGAARVAAARIASAVNVEVSLACILVSTADTKLLYLQRGCEQSSSSAFISHEGYGHATGSLNIAECASCGS